MANRRRKHTWVGALVPLVLGAAVVGGYFIYKAVKDKETKKNQEYVNSQANKIKTSDVKFQNSKAKNETLTTEVDASQVQVENVATNIQTEISILEIDEFKGTIKLKIILTYKNCKQEKEVTIDGFKVDINQALANNLAKAKAYIENQNFTNVEDIKPEEIKIKNIYSGLTYEITNLVPDKDKKIIKFNLTLIYNGQKSQSKEIIIVQNEELSKRRLGGWNILNFGGGKHNEKSLKVKALATNMYFNKLDIICLCEVNYHQDQAVKYIVDELNNLARKENKNNWYQYDFLSTSSQVDLKTGLENNFDSINSDNAWPKISGTAINNYHNKDVMEETAIIYNKAKFKPIAFDNGKYYAKDLSPVAPNRYYVRPIGCTMFEDIYNKQFIQVMSGHLDSPGVAIDPKTKKDKKQEGFNSEYKRQGNQEVYEAKHLDSTFDTFKNMTSKEVSQIFFGDTNIKTENAKLFDDGKNYKNIYLSSNAAKYKTSLGTHQVGTYANSYDKILFNERGKIDFIDEQEAEAGFKMRSQLWKIFDDGRLNKKEAYDLSIASKENTKNSDDLLYLIRALISDHDMTFIDYKIK